MKQIIHPFRRLQWKLTLSYTLITVATLFFIELLIAIIFLSFVIANEPVFLESGLQQQTLQLTPYFVQNPPDRTAITTWLHTTGLGQNNPLSDLRHGYLTIVDSQGRVIASLGGETIPAGTMLDTKLSAQASTNLRNVLSGETEAANGLNNHESDGTVIVMVPISQKEKGVLGALIMKTTPLSPQKVIQSSSSVIAIVLPNVIVLTIIAGIAGTIFGFFTARGFIRRFKRLSTAADNWSKGNFSTSAIDTSGDELGQLTRQLNRMAEQMQILLQTRQKLAALEERNRLARDLHDSVKQQVFALAMQIGAAKTLLGRDPEKAQTYLNEAENLVHQAQQELTALIRELRPVALEGKGFVVALKELVTQWTNQTGIAANLQVEGDGNLPFTVEEALFRIAQEALANIARHSHASTVQLRLTFSQDSVTLTISDNGQGFDATATHNHGIGLHSMRERMKMLGGEVDIQSKPGQGTVITARYEKQNATV